MELHSKILELRLKSAPINYSSTEVNGKGELVDDRRIKGYLAVWGVKDDRGTVFVKGCCSKSLQERGPNSNAKNKIPFLYYHKPDEPLCIFDVLKEDDYGLYFEAVPDEIPTGDRVVTQVRSGTLNQFSWGFHYIWDKMEYKENQDAVYCYEIDLQEGSVLTFASNTETYAIRSAEQAETAIIELQEQTEDFIKTIPKRQQLELRQIITRHISLAKIEPLELRQRALMVSEPTADIDYDYLLNNINKTT